MKKTLFLLAFLGFVSFAHASTNCSTGCDIDGATLTDMNFTFYNWNNGANDASVSVRNNFGAVVAVASTGSVSSWGTKQNLNYFLNTDGNYTLQFFAQGTNNDYNTQIGFKSGGSNQQYSDVNCAGTSCGGSTKIYKLNINNTPSTSIDDNHTVGFTVKGGTNVNVKLNFLQGGDCFTFNPCDVSAAIRRLSDNNIVAFRRDSSWTSWTGGNILDWIGDYDGNYALEVFYEGSVGRYDLNLTFIDTSSTTRTLVDEKQFIGSAFGTGLTTQYFLGVANSPAVLFDDGMTFSPTVKGGTTFFSKIRFTLGHDCFVGNPCNANIKIRRLSDNNVVAYRSTSSWSSWGSFTELEWLADYDSSYRLEVFYEGTYAQYDLNVYYIDTNSIVRQYSDAQQYIGSGLSTGNNTDYTFNVANSPAVLLDDGLLFSPAVKGGTVFNAYIRTFDGHDCFVGNPCNVNIAIRRVSDNNILAFRSDSSWQSWSSFQTLDWLADKDGTYAIDVFYEGSFGQLDLNVDYTNANNSFTTYLDQNQYFGSALATGNVASYFFTVSNSPPVLFDYEQSVLYKPVAGSLFKATIKMYDGHDCFTYNPCNGSISIKDFNGSTIATNSQTNYANLNNVVLQFFPQINHNYYIETFYEGVWVQYDLNVDYTDTTGVTRHFEDNRQYLGSGVATTNDTNYYFDGGASCGSGVFCPNSACKQVLINGNPLDKIDVVFIGSGFPDSNKFESAVDFAIDNSNGLFSFEPFKTYMDRFNVWMVDLNKTYQIGLTSGGWRFGADLQKDAQDNCPSGNEFVLLSIEPRFRSYVVPDINKSNLPTGQGTHWAHILLGCEFLGDCNYPVDYNGSNPYDTNCQGGGLEPACNLATDPDNEVNVQKGELQRVITHEFGHSFGGLWDEYATSQNSPYANSGELANCDNINTCPKWIADVNACISTCGYLNWYKAYNRTLMHDHFTPRVEFMAVNKNELTSDILSYQTAKLPDIINTLVAYVLTFSYESGSFNLLSLELVEGYPPEIIDSASNQYRAEILSPDNEKLYDINFIVPTNLLYEPYAEWFNDGNQIFTPSQLPVSAVSDVNFVMVLPYFENGSKINVLDENNSVLLSVDTSQYNRKVSTLTGFAGGLVSNSNYTVRYSITDQPTSTVSNGFYKAQLGWRVYYEN